MATTITSMSTPAGSTYAADSAIATAERLYQVQSRAARSLYTTDGNLSYTDRGSVAYIRLVTTNNLLGGTPMADRANKAGIDSDTWNLLIGNGIASASNTSYYQYDRFLLTDCEVSYSEKTQIVTTFGDNEVVYYFGKNPVIMNLSGMLVDSLTDDWFSSFVKIYQTFLRGTVLAKNFEMIELVLPTMKVVGSIMSLTHQQNSSRDTDVPFRMQFYAKSIEMLPSILQTSNVANNNSVKPIFTNPTKSGVSSSGIATGPSVKGGFTEPAWIQNASTAFSTGYANFKNNVISPVVSVIATIAKTVLSVTSSISNLVSSFTTPINMVLRDVMSISVQATAIANLVQSSAAGIGAMLATPGINLKNTLSSLKNTVGVISRLPESVSDAFKNNFHVGNIQHSAAILSSGVNGTTSKKAVLSSGTPYSASNSFTVTP